MDKRVQGTFNLGHGSSSAGVISYTGEFRDDLFHGRGKMLLSDQGTVYEGVFEKGRCAKFGRLVYRDGSLYLGEMKDFKRQGNGIYLRASGERFEGEFSSDQATGTLQVFYPDGRYYIGSMKDFKRDGQGRLYYTNNSNINSHINVKD